MRPFAYTRAEDLGAAARQVRDGARPIALMQTLQGA